MKKAYLPLTKEEVGIVLGVRLMYWGVPFHRARKRALSRHQEAIGDAVWERLLMLRDAARGRPSTSAGGETTAIAAPCVFLPLSEEEVLLYVEMAKACLTECGDEEIDLRLHLGTSERDKVEQLLAKLQRLQ
jgi:hypothetical protein